MVKSNEKSLPELMSSNGMKIMMGNVKGLDSLKLKLALFSPYKFSRIKKIGDSMKNLNKRMKFNPDIPKVTATKEFIANFEQYAKNMGIISIGYTKIEAQQLLRGHNILYENIIVISMEMDKTVIATSPSREAEKLVLDT